jgi:hypothetical protein
MSDLSDSVFHFDPPQPFAYTDFVIHAPHPRLPTGITEEVAKKKYPKTRLKRLVRVVELQVGTKCCFFDECQPRDQKGKQHVVTKLYALYEVEHWPGAAAQFDWTKFVLANLERDQTRERYGPEVNPACKYSSSYRQKE